jgi:hypothetical protein
LPAGFMDSDDRSMLIGKCRRPRFFFWRSLSPLLHAFMSSHRTLDNRSVGRIPSSDKFSLFAQLGLDQSSDKSSSQQKDLRCKVRTSNEQNGGQIKIWTMLCQPPHQITLLSLLCNSTTKHRIKQAADPLIWTIIENYNGKRIFIETQCRTLLFAHQTPSFSSFLRARTPRPFRFSKTT